jgi:hypothetical protein
MDPVDELLDPGEALALLATVTLFEYDLFRDVVQRRYAGATVCDREQLGMAWRLGSRSAERTRAT